MLLSMSIQLGSFYLNSYHKKVNCLTVCKKIFSCAAPSAWFSAFLCVKRFLTMKTQYPPSAVLSYTPVRSRYTSSDLQRLAVVCTAVQLLIRFLILHFGHPQKFRFIACDWFLTIIMDNQFDASWRWNILAFALLRCGDSEDETCIACFFFVCGSLALKLLTTTRRCNLDAPPGLLLKT